MVLEVHDEKAGTVQVIKAASVTYNQTRRSVSAEGGVEYSLTRGGKTDTFTGASLAFNLDTSEAVFYDGKTTRSATQQGGGDLKYTFRGETMTRLSNDTVILQNGSLTSSDMLVDPLLPDQGQPGLAPGAWENGQSPMRSCISGGSPSSTSPASSAGDDFFSTRTSATAAARVLFSRPRRTSSGASQRRIIPFPSCSFPTRGTPGTRSTPRVVPPQGSNKRARPCRRREPEAHAGCLFPPRIPGWCRGGFLSPGNLPHQPGSQPHHFRRLLRAWPVHPVPAGPPLLSPYSLGQQFWNPPSILGLPVPFRYGLEGTVKTTGDVFSANPRLPVLFRPLLHQ